MPTRDFRDLRKLAPTLRSMILALLAVEEMLILSDVSGTSSTRVVEVEGEWRSGVETDVVRLVDGPEKLNALFNLEDKD